MWRHGTGSFVKIDKRWRDVSGTESGAEFDYLPKSALVLKYRPELALQTRSHDEHIFLHLLNRVDSHTGNSTPVFDTQEVNQYGVPIEAGFKAYLIAPDTPLPSLQELKAEIAALKDLMNAVGNHSRLSLIKPARDVFSLATSRRDIAHIYTNRSNTNEMQRYAALHRIIPETVKLIHLYGRLDSTADNRISPQDDLRNILMNVETMLEESARCLVAGGVITQQEVDRDRKQTISRATTFPDENLSRTDVEGIMTMREQRLIDSFRHVTQSDIESVRNIIAYLGAYASLSLPGIGDETRNQYLSRAQSVYQRVVWEQTHFNWMNLGSARYTRAALRTP